MRAATAIEAPEAPDRLDDIRWMVHSMETLTLAGQRHEMKKTVSLLEQDVIHGRSHNSSSKLETIESLLAALRREAGRLLPDIRSFAAQAEILIGTVDSVT